MNKSPLCPPGRCRIAPCLRPAFPGGSVSALRSGDGPWGVLVLFPPSPARAREADPSLGLALLLWDGPAGRAEGPSRAHAPGARPDCPPPNPRHGLPARAALGALFAQGTRSVTDREAGPNLFVTQPQLVKLTVMWVTPSQLFVFLTVPARLFCG